MSTDQLLRGSPISSDCLGKAKQGSFVLKGNGCEMNAYVTNRTNDTDKQRITSGLLANGRHLPFLTRKCGCAECIIAREKMELRHPRSIQNGRHGSCLNESFFNQTKSEYSHKRQIKEQRIETHPYSAQLRNGTGSSWAEKHRFRPLACDNISHPLQYNNNPRMSEMYATTLSPNGTDPFSRMLSIGPVGKGNLTETNHWAWNGSLDSSSKHKTQLQLSSIQQPYLTQQLSRDPRLRRKNEPLNGNDASSIYSMYQAQENAELVQRGQEGHKHQSNEDNTMGCWDQRPKRALDWNFSSKPQPPQPQHIPSIYPERWGVNAVVREHKVRVNERKDRPCRISKPSRTSLEELSIKHTTVNERSHSSNATPWDNPYDLGVKTYGTSRVENKKDSKRTSTSVENCGSESKQTKGNLKSFPNDHMLRSKPQWNIDDEELKNETQHLEMVAREERIRSLKSLLAKQEQALESLRFRKKPSKNKAIHKPSTRHKAISIDQGNFNKSSDQPQTYSSTGTTSGNSLKRRWLQNWDEEEEPEPKHPVKKEKENERQSNGSLSENENQNLSNAEFTALEGLVTLSKN